MRRCYIKNIPHWRTEGNDLKGILLPNARNSCLLMSVSYALQMYYLPNGLSSVILQSLMLRTCVASKT